MFWEFENVLFAISISIILSLPGCFIDLTTIGQWQIEEYQQIDIAQPCYIKQSWAFLNYQECAPRKLYTSDIILALLLITHDLQNMHLLFPFVLGLSCLWLN